MVYSILEGNGMVDVAFVYWILYRKIYRGVSMTKEKINQFIHYTAMVFGTEMFMLILGLLAFMSGIAGVYALSIFFILLEIMAFVAKVYYMMKVVWLG